MSKGDAMTNVILCDPEVMQKGPTSIKARQQAMWASGDFAGPDVTQRVRRKSSSAMSRNSARLRPRGDGASCRGPDSRRSP